MTPICRLEDFVNEREDGDVCSEWGEVDDVDYRQNHQNSKWILKNSEEF